MLSLLEASVLFSLRELLGMRPSQATTTEFIQSGRVETLAQLV